MDQPTNSRDQNPTLSRRTRQGWGTRRKAECPLFARRFVRLSSTEGFLGQTHVIAGKQVVALHDLGVGNFYYAGNLGFGIAEQIGSIRPDHGQRSTAVHTGCGQVDDDQTSVDTAGDAGTCQLCVRAVTDDNALTLTTGDDKAGACVQG